MADPAMRKGFALVGAGLFGERHAQAYSRHPSVDFVTVCDLDGDRAKRIADTYGARRHTTSLARIFAQHNQALRRVFNLTGEVGHTAIGQGVT